MKTSLLVLSTALAATSALDVKLSGINYNPRKGADWEPLEKKCKSVAEVTADMKILAGITSSIRLYSMTDCNQMELVLPAAKAAGLSVWAGLWVDKNAATFQAEKDAFAALLKKGVIDSNVIGLHVGSEAIYRKEITADQAIKYFQDVKKLTTDAGLKIPITIADIGDVYVANPQLFNAVDIVSANAFPFWENKPIEGCIEYFYSRMIPLINLAKAAKKDIMISETGWATAGKAEGAGIASPENAAIWFNDFHTLATELKWKYYYYTSFDTTWRHNPNVNSSDPEVENYFGLYDDKGVLKPTYANLKVKKRVDVISSVGNSSGITTAAPNGTDKTVKPSTGSTGAKDNSTNSSTPGTGTTPKPAASSASLVSTAVAAGAMILSAIW